MDRLIFVAVAAFVLLLLAAILTPPEALGAVSQKTRSACVGNYFAYCGHTTPGTARCRACFRSNWMRLDKTCQLAIRQDPAYKHHFKKR